MKRKKVVSIVLAGTVLLSSMGLLSVVDPVLQSASEITSALFNANLADGYDGEKKIAAVSSTYLKGMDDEEDYILSVCESGGYAIYAKDNLELLEYSDIGTSPYAGIRSSKRYYAGPVNYYEENSKGLQNLHSKKTIGEADAKLLGVALKNQVQAKRVERAEVKAKKEEELKKIQETTPWAVNDAKGGVPPPQSNADDLMWSSRSLIDGFEYFVDNTEIHRNAEGSCTVVATQLMLGYNNWKNDGRLIPSSHLNVLDSAFADEDTNGSGRIKTKFLPDRSNEIIAQPYNPIMMQTEHTAQRDHWVSLFEALYTYTYNRMPLENPVGNEGSNFYQAKTALETYFSEFTSITSEDVILSVGYSNPNYVGSEILGELDANRPVVVSIEYMEVGETEPSRHAVVAYGEQSIIYQGNELYGFIVHFGYTDKSDTKVWIPLDWIDGYLTMETTHTHNEVGLNGGNHIVQCSSCSRTAALDNHLFNGVERIMKPADNSDDAGDTTYSTHHYGVCCCGQKQLRGHVYSYSQCDGTEIDEDGVAVEKTVYHKQTCICGYVSYDNHLIKGGKCFYCEYIPEVKKNDSQKTK